MLRRMTYLSKTFLVVTMSTAVASYASVVSQDLLDDYYAGYTGTFNIGGYVRGLEGDGLVLWNEGETLAIDGNGKFVFETRLADGSDYHVIVLSQLDDIGQTCRVSNNFGTVEGKHITDVSVTCSAYCNVYMVSGDTEYFDTTHEACEMLAFGPDYSIEESAAVSLSSGWDIEFLPGFSIEQGAILNADVLGQSLCTTSSLPIPYGRHSYVEQICSADPFCCDTEFDQICLDKVESMCGLVCEQDIFTNPDFH